MLFFGAQDPKDYIELFYIFELLTNMFFEGKSGVCGMGELQASDLDPPYFAGDNLSTKALDFIHELYISLF